MTTGELIEQCRENPEEYPLYTEHLHEQSRLAVADIILRMSVVTDSRERESELLDWEVLPAGEWEVLVQEATESVGGRCTSIAERRDRERISRLKMLNETRERWMADGYKTRMSIGIMRQDGKPGYIVLTRIRETSNGFVEDAVADCLEYPSAMYALSGEDGDWREVFRASKPTVRSFFKKSDVKGRFIHRGNIEARLREYIG